MKLYKAREGMVRIQVLKYRDDTPYIRGMQGVTIPSVLNTVRAVEC